MRSADRNSFWTDSTSEAETEEIEYGLSHVLASGIGESVPDDVERWLRDAVPGLRPAVIESVGHFLRDVGRDLGHWAASPDVRQAAGQAVQVAAPLIGGAYGGPVGVAIGAQVGQVAGQAVAGAPKTTKPGPTPPTPTGPLQAGEPPAPQVVAQASAPAMPAGPHAAAELVHLLDQPGIRASLLSAMMGQYGRTTIPVAGKEVPVPAIIDLVAMLAGQVGQSVSTAGAATEEVAPDYLVDSQGRWLADPADPAQRAAAVLMLVHQEQEEEEAFGYEEAVDDGEDLGRLLDELNDEPSDGRW